MALPVLLAVHRAGQAGRGGGTGISWEHELGSLSAVPVCLEHCAARATGTCCTLSVLCCLRCLQAAAALQATVPKVVEFIAGKKLSEL